jgi:CubicO group peptidase (beta-lactamase class C family)
MDKINQKFALACLSLIICGLYLLGCTTYPAPITEKSGDYDFAQFLETIRQEEKLPAIAASVIISGDTYVKAAVGTRKYGTDNWVTIDDKFLIGSCGKAFTATLAAILIEEGVLEWDTTVQDVFPELEMHPKWENITLQQLLSNRSGYVDDINTHVLPWEELADLWNCKGPSADIRFNYVKRAVNQNPIHPPDKVIIYANSGFIVAGGMLEKVTQKTFEKLMEEKLFVPLELKSAGYGSPAVKDPIGQPHGHSKHAFYTAMSQDLPDFIAPMGNVAISIVDWSKFILFHLEAHQDTHTRLLESIDLEKLHRPPNSAHWNYGMSHSWFFKKADELDTTKLNYALAWFTEKKNNGNFLIGHKGQGSSFTAVVHADPRTKNAVLLVANAKVSQIHLRKAAEAIKNHYAALADLPVVTMPTYAVWR